MNTDENENNDVLGGDPPNDSTPILLEEGGTGERDRLRAEFFALKENRVKLSETLDTEVSNLKVFEEELAPLVLEERRLTGIIAVAEENEHSTEDVETRRKYEKERFGHMEERSVIEHKKQELESKIETTRIQNEEMRERLHSLMNQERILGKALEKIEFTEERDHAEAELKSIISLRIEMEKKLEGLREIKKTVTAELSNVSEKEENIEHIEEEVKESVSISKTREEEVLKEEEWFDLDKKRHEIESSRWGVEDRMKEAEGNLRGVEDAINDLRNKEEELNKKIEALSVKQYALDINKEG